MFARNPVGDRAVSDPNAEMMPAPMRISPVRVSEMSAPNRVRSAVVKALYEFARWRTPMSGEYLVLAPAPFHRIANRRLARPARFRRVIPNVRGVYAAPTYGGPVRTVTEQ